MYCHWCSFEKQVTSHRFVLKMILNFLMLCDENYQFYVQHQHCSSFLVLIFSVSCMSVITMPEPALKITGEVSGIVLIALGYLVSFIRYQKAMTAHGKKSGHSKQGKLQCSISKFCNNFAGVITRTGCGMLIHCTVVAILLSQQ